MFSEYSILLPIGLSGSEPTQKITANSTYWVAKLNGSGGIARSTGKEHLFWGNSNGTPYFPNITRKSRLTYIEPSPCFLILQKNRPPGYPSFFNRPLDHRLFPHEFSLPLLRFYQNDTDRISLLVLCVSVPSKDNEVDRSPDEPGISRRERKLRQERGYLHGDPALQHRARSID